MSAIPVLTPSSSRTAVDSPLPLFTWEEILRHDQIGDLWIVINGIVYDVSDWVARHPGGSEVYVERYGRDAGPTFDSVGHSQAAQHLAESFKIGLVDSSSLPPESPVEPRIRRQTVSPVIGPGPLQSGPKLRPLSKAENAPRDPREQREYDWDEIAKHNKTGDFWIVFAGSVYDVSEWIFHHPGGAEVFLQAHGQDVGQAFGKAGHSAEAINLAKTFKIGRLKRARPGAETPGTDLSSAPAPASAETLREIPYAIRWLVPDGERFANFDILNDNDTQLDYYQRFGHVYAVGIPTKKWRLVVVSDPLLLDEVAGNEEQFGKRVEDINFFDQLAGSRGGGISVVGDSDYYNRVRHVMLPWYAPAHQKTQFERMRDVAVKTMEAWAKVPDEQALDLREWMERYSLEISGRGACNYDFQLLEPNAEKSEFAVAVPESTKQSIARVAEPRPDFTIFSGPAKRARKRRYDHQTKVLFRTAQALVEGRVNTCPAGVQTDLLSRLTTTPDPQTGRPLDVGTVRDQILMHLSNGFNGPSIAAAWLGYVLATHPTIEERLVAEIDDVTGGDPQYQLQYADLMALPYMTQVIKETLRVYPPMPITIRRSLKDGRLGQYRIRRDDIILVGALAAQRDERFWGTAASEFDPDQFEMERVVNRPRHAFIPFSVGTRQCMAQEVSFMMLRVALFEMYNRYRLRLAPGAVVRKNTIVTTKPAAVPVIRVPREGRDEREAAVASRRSARRSTIASLEADGGHAWDLPLEIPADSPFQQLLVAYGSNFGSNKRLAEFFAGRSRRYGFHCEVINLDELADMPARSQPWVLVIMTATYTSNPPGNAIAFKSWVQKADAGCDHWQNCRYLVWGLGNSQWNAFLAFPKYVHSRLRELGALPLGELGFGDVGSPVWEDVYAAWNNTAWPALIKLAGATPTEAAKARVEAEEAAAAAVARADSTTSSPSSIEGTVIEPVILTNAVGITSIPARVTACRELQNPESPNSTRHIEVELPEGTEYAAGDHLGVCPQNDSALVVELASRLGVPLDGMFSVPKSLRVQAVPSGVPLHVRNVLTCLVDIAGLPTVQFLDLLLTKAQEPEERSRLVAVREALVMSSGSPLGQTIAGGGYDVVRLLREAPTASINIFEFLQTAQPLRPRFYSTSSSPRIHGQYAAHISVGFSEREIPGVAERRFHGMSSHYVHSLREGDIVNVFVDRVEGFRLAGDMAKPMIFVSAGTGFAPMRAFLWERLAMRRAGQELGPALLFNGIRSSRFDYIYRDEIEMFVEQGVLDETHIAMSREIPGTADYVQDRILRQGANVWSLIEAGGSVYICGSQSMREDVRKRFLELFSTYGKLDPATAEAYMERLETVESRYRADVWG